MACLLRPILCQRKPRPGLYTLVPRGRNPFGQRRGPTFPAHPSAWQKGPLGDDEVEGLVQPKRLTRFSRASGDARVSYSHPTMLWALSTAKPWGEDICRLIRHLCSVRFLSKKFFLVVYLWQRYNARTRRTDHQSGGPPNCVTKRCRSLLSNGQSWKPKASCRSIARFQTKRCPRRSE